MRPQLAAVVFAIAVLPSIAQNPAPSTQPEPTTTLHATAHLVVLDEVVEDKSHNPVRGLKAADFAVDRGQHPIKIACTLRNTIRPARAIPRGRRLFPSFRPAPLPTSDSRAFEQRRERNSDRRAQHLIARPVIPAQSASELRQVATRGLPNSDLRPFRRPFHAAGLYFRPQGAAFDTGAQGPAKAMPRCLEDSLRGTGNVTLNNLVADASGGVVRWLPLKAALKRLAQYAGIRSFDRGSAHRVPRGHSRWMR